MSNRIRLAVYGTLKSTHPNHSILGPSAEVLARGITLPNMSLYNIGWFPGVIHNEHGTGVEVELVEIDASVLRVVDGYEGYRENDGPRNLFNRELVKLPNGEDALIYIYNDTPPQAGLIPSGRWEDAKIPERP
jgi:gamma-glutamylcyclotransferase (GGCT)/AIG2-like uncharacterized protein YtfP